MKKNKLLTLMGMLSVFVLFTSLNLFNEADADEKKNKMTVIGTSEHITFDNVSDLTLYATDIVIGEIVNEEENSNFVKFEFQVEQTLKGELSSNEIIDVYLTSLEDLQYDNKYLLYLEL
ncbi:hypothetical protein [Longirhabdus pacifica]|uniref:hypothetical protein n=1 Tax=Longirhabdus pacifica TaxID=2305227 RepID=UPI001008D529|nr:hypothetical protein [Longirhabdus pacifica]